MLFSRTRNLSLLLVEVAALPGPSKIWTMSAIGRSTSRTSLSCTKKRTLATAAATTTTTTINVNDENNDKTDIHNGGDSENAESNKNRVDLFSAAVPFRPQIT